MTPTSRTDGPSAAPNPIAALLRDPRRRQVLDCLAARTGPVDLEALAGDLAASPVWSGSSDGVERVAFHLHHRHLPKMDDVGLVDYDADRRVVEAADDGRPS